MLKPKRSAKLAKAEARIEKIAKRGVSKVQTARPEWAEVLSPGQHPGRDSN